MMCRMRCGRDIRMCRWNECFVRPGDLLTTSDRFPDAHEMKHVTTEDCAWRRVVEADAFMVIKIDEDGPGSWPTVLHVRTFNIIETNDVTSGWLRRM